MPCMNKSKHEEESKEDNALLKDVKSAVGTNSGTEQENNGKASASSQATEVVGGTKRKIAPPKWFTPNEKETLAAEDKTEGLPATSVTLLAPTKRVFHDASEEDEKADETAVKKMKLNSEADDVSEAASVDTAACSEYGPNYPACSDNEADSDTESKAGSEDTSMAVNKGNVSLSDNETTALDHSAAIQNQTSEEETDWKTFVARTEANSAQNSSDEADASTVGTLVGEDYAGNGDTDLTSNNEVAENGDDAPDDEEDDSGDESDESSCTRWRIAHGLQERKRRPSISNNFYLGGGWYGDAGVMDFIA
ncbi:MAG: hypothetical protein LQ352_000150 [Teloschistes flavicans]|nr:MAG: hypothetical protein LQ352_000150 [Teloschistes flavicans]